MNELSFSITGDREVIRMFEELPDRAQDRVLKPLVQNAGEIIANAIEAEAPSQSGLMKSAIGVSKLRLYSHTIFITAGVRRGFRRAVTAFGGNVKFRSAAFTSANPNAQVQDPVKYLHLVTGGRRAISAMNRKVLFDPRTEKYFGKSVKEARANPFVDRAFDRVKEPVVSMITNQAPDLIIAEASSLLTK